MKRLATLVLTLAALMSGCSWTMDEESDEARDRPRGTGVEETVTIAPSGSLPMPTRGIWISGEQLQELPTSGTAWERMKAAADERLGRPEIAELNSNHDVKTLAVALVYARTGDPHYRKKAADAIAESIGTEEGGRTLELGRNLISYVIAADLIDFQAFDPVREAEFRDWLEAVRNEPLGADEVTLIRTTERSPSNWGGMAIASRIAVAAYLGDEQDLARAARVMQGWLGDRSAYPGIPADRFESDDVGEGLRFGGSKNDLSWQADPSRPTGVNPQGAEKDGHSIDGALPDDMRRGAPFTWPPVYTQYPREAMSGYVAAAELLYRQGYDVYDWSDKALLRAARFLYDLELEFPDENWWEPGLPAYWIINSRYGASFPVEGKGVGRNMGWTDWTHAQG